ncbi:hypothetical protein Slin14017_G110860 [Septoria linicola]|nr:hypothetical protein Slin14017_G110860 [Septoria linicola]
MKSDIGTAISNDWTQGPGFIRQHLEQGTVTLNILQLCLNACQKAVEMHVRSERGKVLEHIKELQLARLVLICLLRDPALLYALVMVERSACGALAYFAVSEGLESHLFSCFELPIFGPGGNQYWRGRLLYYICTAHNVLDNDECADLSLMAFFRGYDRVVLETTSSPSAPNKDTILAECDITHHGINAATFELADLVTNRTRLLGRYNTDPNPI